MAVATLRCISLCSLWCNLQALGINDAGQIVGNYVDSSGVVRGYVYNGTTWTSLDYFQELGAGYTATGGINDWDQIVGWYEDAGGVEHGFLATPSTTMSVTTGTNVTVALGPQVELIFADVTSAGTVTAALSLPGSVAAPVNFTLLGGTSSYI